MVTDVGHLQRKVRGKRMLHTEGPVPDVGRGQIAVHAHDGAGTADAIDRAVVNRCDRAAWYDARRRNTARAKGVVEGDERLPVQGFVNQTGPAADHGWSFAVGIPGKPEARREVLVVRLIEAADLIGARVHLH